LKEEKNDLFLQFFCENTWRSLGCGGPWATGSLPIPKSVAGYFSFVELPFTLSKEVGAATA